MKRARLQTPLRVAPAVLAARVQLAAHPTFELLVVGCGGGPDETNLSSYLLRASSSSWIEGCTALEGGSGLGALTRLVENAREQSPDAFVDFGGRVTDPPGHVAGRIWDSIRCFAITHAHLDHIQGLAISSAASLSAKPLFATASTIGVLERLFDGWIWPRLCGYASDGITIGRAYLYHTIPTTHVPLQLSESLSMITFLLSHGATYSDAPDTPNNNACPVYSSTAFLIREAVSGNEFLFFGDVEPDSISHRSFNLAIWRHVAPIIVDGRLDTIFIECSYPSSQPKEKLWGHMSPGLVLDELQVLAGLVRAEQVLKGGLSEGRPLQGVTVVITHIKDDVLSPSPPRTASSPTWPLNLILSPRSRSPLSMAPPLPDLNRTRRASGGQILPPSSCSSAAERNSSVTHDVSRRASLPGSLGSLSVTTRLLKRSADGSGWDREAGVVEEVDEEEEEEQQVEEEELTEETMPERIERELNELEGIRQTGVRFIIATQGMRISF